MGAERDEHPNGRQRVGDRRDHLDVFGADDEHGRGRVGDDLDDLWRGQPPVHRHRDGADLARTEEQLEELQRVLAEIADALAAPDAGGAERAGDLVRAQVELGERQPAIARGERRRVGPIARLRSGERGDRSNRVGSSRTTIHGPLIVAVCASDGKE